MDEPEGGVDGSGVEGFGLRLWGGRGHGRAAIMDQPPFDPASYLSVGREGSKLARQSEMGRVARPPSRSRAWHIASKLLKQLKSPSHRTEIGIRGSWTPISVNPDLRYTRIWGLVLPAKDWRVLGREIDL